MKQWESGMTGGSFSAAKGVHELLTRKEKVSWFEGRSYQKFEKFQGGANAGETGTKGRWCVGRKEKSAEIGVFLSNMEGRPCGRMLKIFFKKIFRKKENF